MNVRYRSFREGESISMISYKTIRFRPEGEGSDPGRSPSNTSGDRSRKMASERVKNSFRDDCSFLEGEGIKEYFWSGFDFMWVSDPKSHRLEFFVGEVRGWNATKR